MLTTKQKYNKWKILKTLKELNTYILYKEEKIICIPYHTDHIPKEIFYLDDISLLDMSFCAKLKMLPIEKIKKLPNLLEVDIQETKISEEIKEKMRFELQNKGIKVTE